MQLNWRVARSAAVLAGSPEPERLLNPQEADRRSRLRLPQDRDDFLAARVLARQLISEHALPGVPELAQIRLHQRCPRCGAAHGRPSVEGHPGVQLSWSHAGGTVAAVVADRPVGIDHLRGTDSDPVLEFGGRTRTAREWVRAEALVKAGAGDLDELLALDLRGGGMDGFQLMDERDPDTGATLAIALGVR